MQHGRFPSRQLQINASTIFLLVASIYRAHIGDLILAWATVETWAVDGLLLSNSLDGDWDGVELENPLDGLGKWRDVGSLLRGT